MFDQAIGWANPGPARESAIVQRRDGVGGRAWPRGPGARLVQRGPWRDGPGGLPAVWGARLRSWTPWCLGLLAGAVGLRPLGATPQQLRSLERVVVRGQVLNVGSQAIPCVADWNGDGLPDLLIGYQPAFKVAVYTNSGTPGHPVFAGGFANLQAGGADIYLPSGGCGSPAPWVGDYDRDGLPDLLVGSGSDGRVYFYRNTRTAAQPVLAAGVPLMLLDGILSVNYRATPCIHDWDEDGLPDLLCGDGDGRVHFFRNVGTAQAPAYATDVLLQAGGGTLNLGVRSVVRVADWDGDGRKDLIGSGSDNAAWCRNVGSNPAPVLNAPARLQAPIAAGALAAIDTGYRMRLDLADWNLDGIPDLLIGTHDGYVNLYEGYRLAIQGISRSPDNVTTLQWASATYLTYTILAGPTPIAATTPIANGVASGGKTTAWTGVCPDSARFYRVSQP